MSGQGQAIPKAFNLGLEKPVTIPAYGRQVQSIATNAQSFGPNTIANIVIDTATPGAFLDPMQSLIEFDITFTNDNPNVDFINLSASGLGSLIQEMRIYCQGTPIVEILDYNLAFETWMKLNNFQQQEFKLYMESSWRAPVAAGESDLNFVKPPMVDLNGSIMWPTDINNYGDPNTHAKKSIGHYLSMVAGSTNNQNSDSVNTSGNANWFTATTGVNYNGSFGTAVNFLPVNTAKSPGTGVAPAGYAATTAQATDMTGAAGTSPWNYSHNYNPLDINSNYSDAPGTICSMTWTNRIDNTYVTWPSTIRPEKKESNLGIKLQEIAMKNYRLEDYLMYLSNVKNIPVGISPAKSFIANNAALERPVIVAAAVPPYPAVTTAAGNETSLANWNLTNPAVDPTQTNTITDKKSQGSFTYHGCLPFFDGLLGMGAEKQFPTMLIAPGSLYIQIRFAKVEQGTQLTMDPCRRIFGTHRDYVPNVGSSKYYATEYYGNFLNTDRCTMFGRNDAGLSLTGAPTPEQIAAVKNTWMAYTPHAARGTDFAWNGILALQPPTDASTKGTALNHAFVINSVTGNGRRNNIFYNNYVQPGQFDPNSINAVNPIPNYQGFNEGLSTGLPKPQYVPMSNPWTYSGNYFHYPDANKPVQPYCFEQAVCYGTYLPCSTAQVRRTTTGAFPGSSTANITNLNTLPNYTIQNLRYTGYQTILSNEIVAAIVKSAAREDVSIQGQTWKTYRTICAASENQTIILPIKIASANSIHCIFQNNNMYENPNYNSLSPNCPLTHFRWNVDADHFVGSDTAPVLTGVATTGTPFSIQLRLGNELLPIQPITTVAQLLSEYERSIHIKGNMNESIQAKGITVGQASSTTYGSLAHRDFLTPYVPIAALDDQTITDNPAFMDYLNLGYANFRDRGNYSTGLFIPPESDFILGFDLDTFPGNSDNARSGRYLGNAPLTLQMTGAKGIGNAALSSATSTDSWSCIAIVLCDIRFSIGAGGAIQAYY